MGLRLHLGQGGALAGSTAVGDDHCQVRKHNCSRDQHPAGPARDENCPNDAGGANAHGYEVLTGSAGLLTAERVLGTRDAVGRLRHSNKVNPNRPGRLPR